MEDKRIGFKDLMIAIQNTTFIEFTHLWGKVKFPNISNREFHYLCDVAVQKGLLTKTKVSGIIRYRIKRNETTHK